MSAMRSNIYGVPDSNQMLLKTLKRPDGTSTEKSRDSNVPKYELEKSIENKIRLALCEEGVFCLKNNIDNRNLHTGLGEGSADIICIVPPNGRMLAIEVKSFRPGSRPSEKQLRFIHLVRQFGGIAGVARSVQEALELLNEARV